MELGKGFGEEFVCCYGWGLLGRVTSHGSFQVVWIEWTFQIASFPASPSFSALLFSHAVNHWRVCFESGFAGLPLYSPCEMGACRIRCAMIFAGMRGAYLRVSYKFADKMRQGKKQLGRWDWLGVVTTGSCFSSLGWFSCAILQIAF